MSESSGLSARERSLIDAATAVNSARSEVTQLCKGLSDRIAGMGQQWGGQGATAFHQLHTAWQEKQNKIVSALDNFEQSLQQTDKDNKATDEAQAQASSNLMNRLG
ncbi:MULTISPECIES: WXG100 family type VII secretion target [Nocardioides]|uniref:WXG100 family type VII secretion target n=1 Tax=Nocardioides TaxID=1839 RepID=UPI000C76E024|nr:MULTISPECIES: WXG100 family type VII secretion target [Nocardioides]